MLSNKRPDRSVSLGQEPSGLRRAMLVSDPETRCATGRLRPTIPPAGLKLFIRLLGQSHRSLHLYVMSLVPNRSDAEDVLQQTNLVLWREFPQFQPGTNFAAWACRVAFNQVLAWRKRRQRDRLVFSEAFLEAVSAEVTADAELLEERSHRLAGCIQQAAAPSSAVDPLALQRRQCRRDDRLPGESHGRRRVPHAQPRFARHCSIASRAPSGRKAQSIDRSIHEPR